ncbi:class I SAM-dependent methyltransferase [Ferruginibacter albus]|uniref:class I SAM-dependent methyltransferase n=1 Tax=Ferruginibacter albus TaxID=2875540 RepID=UPI001CC3641E|nr:class I SAM-dependent methyltransferase [Ferruginibacter albus]UAY52953.1 class I SAM-dependent methyltransferase [Ferruginibacter albus]
MSSLQTAERVSGMDPSDNYVFQRSILAYHKATDFIPPGSEICEIGSGEGYAINLLYPLVKKYVALDKYPPNVDLSQYPNLEFQQTVFPPMSNVPSDSFDVVITFQVIEHVQNDLLFLREAHRILKPGGKLIVTTPNKPMSITRNPWHVREYFPNELKNLCAKVFKSVITKGVFGNSTVMEYYEKNKAGVRKITRFDIFNLQYRLPRWMLQIPYDILNRYNRKKILTNNTSLTSGIKMDDYYVDDVNENCFDLFYVMEK